MEKSFEQPKIIEKEPEPKIEAEIEEKEKESIQFIEAALEQEAEMMEKVAEEIAPEKKHRFFKRLTPLIFATTVLGLLSVGSFRKMSFSEAWAQEVPKQEEVAKEELGWRERRQLETPEQVERCPARRRVLLLNESPNWLKVEGLLGTMGTKDFWIKPAEKDPRSGKIIPAKVLMGFSNFGQYSYLVKAYERAEIEKKEKDGKIKIDVKGKGFIDEDEYRIDLDGSRTRTYGYLERDTKTGQIKKSKIEVGDYELFRTNQFRHRPGYNWSQRHRKGPFEFSFPVRRGGGRYVKDRGHHWYPGGGRGGYTRGRGWSR